jgi:hypothetical protein
MKTITIKINRALWNLDEGTFRESEYRQIIKEETINWHNLEKGDTIFMSSFSPHRVADLIIKNIDLENEIVELEEPGL